MRMYIKANAEFSPSGNHRLHLWREWEDPDAYMADADTPLSFTVCGLNPSTAGKLDDRTVRRMVGFARSEGYRRLDLVNLFTFIATKPADMLAHLSENPDNEDIDRVFRVIDVAGQFVVAWGANVNKSYELRRRANHVGHYAGNELPYGPMCWGMTKDGHPKHPLYLSKDTALIPFRY